MVFFAGKVLTAAQLNAEIGALQTATADTGWVTLSSLGYLNGWAQYVDATYGTAAIRKIGKVVSLRGLVTAGSFGVPICNLIPAAYRPSLNLIFASKTSGAQVAVETRVLLSGAIQIQSGTAAAYFSISDCTWMVD